MTTKSVISLVTHPHPFETLRARLDFADISGSDVVENPWWYEHTENGRQFYDLAACIGWPEEIRAGSDNLQPGYAAIVGVVRPKNAEKVKYNARDAAFYVLEEASEYDVPTLLSKCDMLRRKYGWGLNTDFLSVFYGDPERFTTALALWNEFLTHRDGERAALVVAPPDDYVQKNRFEIYVRAIKSVIQQGNIRLYFGPRENSIIRNRLQEFSRDDPAVMAMGGLVHTMITRTLWMGRMEKDNLFYLKEAI